ncbi:hypothetical protein [uncultured Planococcus sp.]|uniref:hypothetical protein n=1 Tax=uncultured Planococcus sp. TaxID=337815 RepID=UPI00261AAEDD|nr:hypothetical protein [uncultured Planococcus sp.]
MSYVPIFHLTVPAVWVAVLLGALAASLMMRFVLGDKSGEWYGNAITLYILVWKFSYILFNFDYFLDMPLSILYFNGGLNGHLLGLAFVTGYLVLAQKKHDDLARQAPVAWLLFFLSYQTILQSLENNWVEAALHGLLLVVSILAIRLLAKRADVPTGLLLVLLFALELLISSLSAPLLSWQNATVLLLAAVTIAMYNRFEKKRQINRAGT